MKPTDLDNDPKITPGFKIPEDYFAQFEEKVMNQLPKKESKVIPLWQRTNMWLSSAAAVFLIAFGTWFFFAQNEAENTITSLDYLAYESDITSQDIAAYLSEEDINTVEKELDLYGHEAETYVNEYLN